MDQNYCEQETLVPAKPRGQAGLTIVGTALVLFAATLPGAVPFAQTEWLNPPRAKRTVVTNLTHAFYYVYDDSAPFAQPSWPNPRVKRGQGGFAYRSATVDTASIPPGDQWSPNPPRPTSRSVVTNLTHTFYYVYDDTAPFAQAVWINPTRRPARPNTGSCTRWSVLDLAVTPPPPLIEWRNPQPAKRRVVTDLTWTRSRSVADVVLPFAQTNWPTPARPRQARVLGVGVRPMFGTPMPTLPGPPSPFGLDDAVLNASGSAGLALRDGVAGLSPGAVTSSPSPFGQSGNNGTFGQGGMTGFPFGLDDLA